MKWTPEQILRASEMVARWMPASSRPLSEMTKDFLDRLEALFPLTFPKPAADPNLSAPGRVAEPSDAFRKLGTDWPAPRRGSEASTADLDQRDRNPGARVEGLHIATLELGFGKVSGDLRVIERLRRFFYDPPMTATSDWIPKANPGAPSLDRAFGTMIREALGKGVEEIEEEFASLRLQIENQKKELERLRRLKAELDELDSIIDRGVGVTITEKAKALMVELDEANAAIQVGHTIAAEAVKQAAHAERKRPLDLAEGLGRQVSGPAWVFVADLSALASKS